jgi:hypothetical protein
MKPAFILAIALVVFSASIPVQAAPTLSAADKAWIEKCATRLISIEKKTSRSAHIYCACMHEMVEDNEEMSQADLEHSWPPVHLSCHKQAGRDREKH